MLMDIAGRIEDTTAKEKVPHPVIRESLNNPLFAPSVSSSESLTVSVNGSGVDERNLAKEVAKECIHAIGFGFECICKSLMDPINVPNQDISLYLQKHFYVKHYCLVLDINYLKIRHSTEDTAANQKIPHPVIKRALNNPLLNRLCPHRNH
ncbi:hypothetical protein CEXT_496261 [Caerostris extrusa]|uniref:Uncharacterized protein n=1 Tax=Caerostris extrusa TaxID=172846 RepID=A0AAV4MX51_CAEEX|nr:hypothetical protein CEXT_496261 [Caerostris extrusa]